MHIQDTNVLNPGRIIRRRVGRYASGLEDRTREREKNRERAASSPGCIKTSYFIIFHIDKGGREEKSGEHDERTTKERDGEARRGEGEGEVRD